MKKMSATEDPSPCLTGLLRSTESRTHSTDECAEAKDSGCSWWSRRTDLTASLLRLPVNTMLADEK